MKSTENVCHKTAGAFSTKPRSTPAISNSKRDLPYEGANHACRKNNEAHFTWNTNAAYIQHKCNFQLQKQIQLLHYPLQDGHDIYILTSPILQAVEKTDKIYYIAHGIFTGAIVAALQNAKQCEGEVPTGCYVLKALHLILGGE